MEWVRSQSALWVFGAGCLGVRVCGFWTWIWNAINWWDNNNETDIDDDHKDIGMLWEWDISCNEDDNDNITAW